MANNLLAGKDPSIAVRKELKNISESLSSIFNQDAKQYAEELIEVFENIAPPSSGSTSPRKRRQSKKKSPQHPGIIIQEIMRERNLTLDRLIPSIKVEIEEFELFLQCARPVDDKFSRELSRLFGKTSIEWLKLQKEYDHFMELNEAKQKAAEN
jgi:plasmid maintenance system antidote protein VapI